MKLFGISPHSIGCTCSGGGCNAKDVAVATCTRCEWSQTTPMDRPVPPGWSTLDGRLLCVVCSL
jgi:hypothetical protein